VYNDFLSVFKGLIPEDIPDQKYRMNMCPILKGYGDVTKLERKTEYFSLISISDCHGQLGCTS
jgi:hypothetical protein